MHFSFEDCTETFTEDVESVRKVAPDLKYPVRLLSAPNTRAKVRHAWP